MPHFTPDAMATGGPVRPPLTELDAKSYADLEALIAAHGDVTPGSR